MGRAVEHRWYGDVAPSSEEQLEQYCRDMGFSPLQPEENVPTPHDDVGDMSLRTNTPPQCGGINDARLVIKRGRPVRRPYSPPAWFAFEPARFVLGFIGPSASAL
jgi:hypothetical protein